jgi:hypothetical protein
VCPGDGNKPGPTPKAGPAAANAGVKAGKPGKPGKPGKTTATVEALLG